MERTFWKNLSMSMLGALIGTFLSLQMAVFAWPLGALAGGLFALPCRAGCFSTFTWYNSH